MIFAAFIRIFPKLVTYFYFAFSVLWSSPVEQLIKSEVLLTTTYHLLQRRDCKIINNAFILEAVSSAKKKEAVCRILRFWLIMKI